MKQPFNRDIWLGVALYVAAVLSMVVHFNVLDPIAKLIFLIIAIGTSLAGFYFFQRARPV